MRYPWHEDIAARLTASCAADTLPHAICLSASPGWGVTQLLNDVAGLLLEIKGPIDASQLAHPDLRWIEPEGSVIKIEQIRAVNQFAVHTAQTAPRKVAALVDADKLNVNAANALLKTLEEPPANTHILLATAHWGKLLPTVRSRCQRFEMSCDPKQALSWLQAEAQASTEGQPNAEVSQALFAELGYAPLAVLNCVRGGGGEVDIETWLANLQNVPLATAVEKALEQDIEAWLGRWYRRILGHLKGQRLAGIVANDRQVLAFTDELLDGRRQLLVSNATNAKLLIERLLSEWSKLSRKPAAN